VGRYSTSTKLKMRTLRVSLVRSFSKRQWEEDCLKYHGRVLTGKCQHWCMDTDDLPVDDTCAEFESCTCPKSGHET
jgi:hypothetical protein